MAAPETRRVFEALTADGAQARFVGGCVRDSLLRRAVKDIDIATDAEPERVIRLLEAARIRAIPTGIDHGTITAVIHPAHFEITTLRHDVETFGRHARVAFTDDWMIDASRRDFTMNSLFCTIDGTLYDPFGGVEDARAGRVRFVGDPRARITEDVLRLLRFFRFQAHYGLTPPEPAALDACIQLAPLLPRLSGERVQGEIVPPAPRSRSGPRGAADDRPRHPGASAAGGHIASEGWLSSRPRRPDRTTLFSGSPHCWKPTAPALCGWRSGCGCRTPTPSGWRC